MYKKRDHQDQVIIALDVGGTKIAAGTVCKNKLIEVIEIPVQARANAKVVFSQICSLIDLLYSPQVQAICVGFPGIVNPKTGTVSVATNIPKFRSIPLKKWLISKYSAKGHIKIFVQNDAKCFALGQLSLSKKEQHIIGLILGTGVGAGIIMNRKIITGKDGAIGEVGDWISSTGKSYEKILSGHDFAKQYHKSGLQLFKSATRGNKKAKQMFESYGEHLAELIAVMTVTYAPQRIILGGSVANASKYFLPATKKYLSQLKLAPQINLPKINVATQKYAGVIGAATLFANATTKSRKK